MVRFPCHTSKESLLHKTKSPDFPCFISSDSIQVQFKGSIQVKHHHVRQVLHIFLGRFSKEKRPSWAGLEVITLPLNWFLSVEWSYCSFSCLTSKHNIKLSPKIRQTSALKIHQSFHAGPWLPWIQLELRVAIDPSSNCRDTPSHWIISRRDVNVPSRGNASSGTKDPHNLITVIREDHQKMFFLRDEQEKTWKNRSCLTGFLWLQPPFWCLTWHDNFMFCQASGQTKCPNTWPAWQLHCCSFSFISGFPQMGWPQ